MSSLNDLRAFANGDSGELDEMLSRMATVRLTPAERREQMISWVMGMLPLNSGLTRTQVKELLEERYGKLEHESV